MKSLEKHFEGVKEIFESFKKAFDGGKEEGMLLDKLLPYIKGGIINVETPEAEQYYENYDSNSRIRDSYGPIRKVSWRVGRMVSLFNLSGS